MELSAAAARGAPRRRRRALALLAAACFSTLAGPAAAQLSAEAGIKAAYLFKFLVYVEWPPAAYASADSPQVIGVLGADAVLAELEQIIATRRPAGRPVVARRLLGSESLDGIHLLYVGRHAPLALRPGQPVLIVTDVPSGLPEGSALNFVSVDHKVRFEAAPQAAAQAGLKLSARLLAVAERVVTP